MRGICIISSLFLVLLRMQAQWVDWSNQYPYPGHRVHAHMMHRTSDGNLLLCASIHGGWTPGSGIPFEDYAIATYLVKVLPTGDTLWTRRIDLIKPWNITHVVDLIDGNTLIAGTAQSNYEYCGMAVSASPMPQVFTLKIDPAGNILWWHQYDEPCERVLADAWETPGEEIHLLALNTQQPNLLIGYIPPTWFENRTLDASGNTLTTPTIQQPDPFQPYVTGCPAYTTGRYLLASSLDTVGQNNTYMQLGRLDGSGAPIWFTTITDTLLRSPRGMVSTADQGLLMLLTNGNDSRLVHTDSLGTVIWDTTYTVALNSLLALPDTTYLGIGSSGGWLSPDLSDLCVTLFSATGDSVWSHFHGDTLYDRGANAVLTPTGYLACGTKDMYSGAVPPRLFLSWGSLGVFLGHPDLATPSARLAIYPDPADHEAMLEVPGSDLRAAHIRLFDAFGREVQGVRMQQTGHRVVVQVGHVATGTYAVVVTCVEGRFVGRMLVVH
ncbi:MAG: hypothetical protein H6594_00495 [Flavobacteriales bacterium]|nr:hypothetical protein [Flavobacteriales bacterium]